MKITQITVMKDALRPEYGSFESLFTRSAHFVDGYVAGVDRTSADKTHEAAGAVLRDTGKPFELYQFDWPHDYSAAMNTALDIAGCGEDDWAFRLDADSRIIAHEGIRELLAGCGKQAGSGVSYTVTDGHLTHPWLFLRGDRRYDGIIFETPDLPTPHKYVRENVRLPVIISHYSPDEKRSAARHFELCEAESERLYGLLEKASTGDDFFRLSSRFAQLGQEFINRRQVEWLTRSRETCEEALRRGFDEAECYVRFAGIFSLIGNREPDAQEMAEEYERKSAELFGDDHARFVEELRRQGELLIRSEKDLLALANPVVTRPVTIIFL